MGRLRCLPLLYESPHIREGCHVSAHRSNFSTTRQKKRNPSLETGCTFHLAPFTALRPSQSTQHRSIAPITTSWNLQISKTEACQGQDGSDRGREHLVGRAADIRTGFLRDIIRPWPCERVSSARPGLGTSTPDPASPASFRFLPARRQLTGISSPAPEPSQHGQRIRIPRYTARAIV